MTDLNKLKAGVEGLKRHEGNVFTYVKLSEVLALIATHAAEPAPVAVEPVAHIAASIAGMMTEWYREHDGPHLEARSIERRLNRFIRADLAPTGNTALVEVEREIIRLAAGCPRREGEMAAYGHALEVIRSYISNRKATLSQPAAPQPTPEVEALLERLRAKGDGPEANLWNAALDAVSAALARASVAEKGERT